MVLTAKAKGNQPLEQLRFYRTSVGGWGGYPRGISTPKRNQDRARGVMSRQNRLKGKNGMYGNGNGVVEREEQLNYPNTSSEALTQHGPTFIKENIVKINTYKGGRGATFRASRGIRSVMLFRNIYRGSPRSKEE